MYSALPVKHYSLRLEYEGSRPETHLWNHFHLSGVHNECKNAALQA